MKNLPPSSGKFILTPHPGSLHQETMSWLSYLEFYKTELSFLSRILEGALLSVGESQDESRIKEIETRLNELANNKLNELYQSILNHEHRLSDCTEDHFMNNWLEINEEHASHREEVNNFMQSVKIIKQEIFDLVEKQLRLVKKIRKEYEEGGLAL